MFLSKNDNQLPENTKRIFDVYSAQSGANGSSKFTYVWQIYEDGKLLHEQEGHFLDSNLYRNSLMLLGDTILHCIALNNNLGWLGENTLMRFHTVHGVHFDAILRGNVRKWRLGYYSGTKEIIQQSGRGTRKIKNQDIWHLLMKLSAFANISVVEHDKSNAVWYKELKERARENFAKQFKTGKSIINLKPFSKHKLEGIYKRRMLTRRKNFKFKKEELMKEKLKELQKLV